MSQPRILYRHGQPISAEVTGLIGTRTAGGGVQNTVWEGSTDVRPVPAAPAQIHLVSTSADDATVTPAVPAVPETDAVTLDGISSIIVGCFTLGSIYLVLHEHAHH